MNLKSCRSRRNSFSRSPESQTAGMPFGLIASSMLDYQRVEPTDQTEVFAAGYAANGAFIRRKPDMMAPFTTPRLACDPLGKDPAEAPKAPSCFP
jgi:hypothetical protein